MWQDLTYAIRRLRRAGWVSAGIILLISVGISANTLIFTLADAFLWRNLPVREPQTLVQFFEIYPNIRPQTFFDYALYQRVADESALLTDVIGQYEFTVPLETNSGPERIYAQGVTDNFFSGLGLRVASGRGIRGNDDHVAVLSHSGWIRRFARDSAVVGRSIRLGAHSYQIVGVMADGFSGTNIDSSPDLWFPFRNAPDFFDNTSRRTTQPYVEIIARLKPGITVNQAEQEEEALWRRFSAEAVAKLPYPPPAGRRDVTFEMRSIAKGLSSVRDQFHGALLALWVGTVLLLLVVTSNAGGLLLARAATGEKETAVRLALGSSRARVMRQWFLESLILSLAGTFLSLPFTYSALRLFLWWLPAVPAAGEYRQLSVTLQPDLTSFAVVTVICSGVALFGSLAPSLHCTRLSINEALKGTSHSKHYRFQSGLCALQIALSAALLIASALMVRTLSKLYAVDSGFDRGHVVTFSIDPRMRHSDDQQNWSLQQRLVEETRSLPGVRAVGISGRAVMRGIGVVTALAVPGASDDTRFNTSMNLVSAGYFDAMGMRILSGRDFQGNENPQQQPTPIIVNEAFERRFFGPQDAIGRQVGAAIDNKRPYEIIGVTSDAHYRSMREVPPPTFYRPLFPFDLASGFVLNVRTSGDSESLIQPVRTVLRSIDPGIPIYEITTMENEIDRSLWQERLTTILATWFGSYALLLCAIGLYGILAYFVMQQRRDFGIRLALGANGYDVLRVILNRLVPVVMIGLAAGAGLYLTGGRYLQNILYGVTVFDGPAITIALILIVSISLAAGVIPWLRAIRINPSLTLKE
jgi:predicted permease